MGYQPDVAGRRVDRLNDTIRRSFITGIALTVPLIVTLLVIGFVLQTVTSAVRPVVQGMNFLFGAGEVPDFVLEIFTLVLLFWFFLGVGFLAERRSGRESRLASTFNELIASIPGIGTVYTGVRQMSETVLSSEAVTDRMSGVSVPSGSVTIISEGLYQLLGSLATKANRSPSGLHS